ncbi:2OG-Fe(II)oxygenase superfamily protein [Diaporthe helianthi]|uniref:2OG-Fe(II)oxygenase superfamily protein n=1 Tax=Diaporthe helianthi TaxID=158607 RepID=A0A2P5HR44_DIAHE|nr:2OG-Fe(II)oxygenase superfamily protein [Diaporthe helianthi]
MISKTPASDSVEGFKFEKLNELTIAYMETTSIEEKDRDSAVKGTGSFEDTQWYNDKDRKLAAYAGHTDIGSLTYLTSNPIAGLQVYGPEGWRHVAHVPNSIVVNMGDAMEYMTRGRMNATLHRVVKPPADQDAKCRPAFIYFIHPNHDIMSKCLAHRRELIAKLSAESKESPGGLVGSIGCKDYE